MQYGDGSAGVEGDSRLRVGDGGATSRCACPVPPRDFYSAVDFMVRRGGGVDDGAVAGNGEKMGSGSLDEAVGPAGATEPEQSADPCDAPVFRPRGLVDFR